MKQILVNLLSNAVKFTPEGGSVTLSVTREDGLGVVSLAVRDTGIGIAEADLPRLFRPFGQLDAGLARHHGGTGLGLVLTKRLVEMHGGQIDVTSRVGVGSTFRVRLPWEPKNPSTPALEASSPLSRRPLESLSKSAPAHRILVVDDNPGNQSVIADYLTARNYDVATADSAAAGLHIARLIRPHLILMDVQMPEIDGLEATKMIRRDPQLSQTPVFALTALAMKGDRERCLTAGMDDYFTKPVRLAELAERIRVRLEGVPIEALPR
jgi:CheY-like chemotaxis protein